MAGEEGGGVGQRRGDPPTPTFEMADRGRRTSADKRRGVFLSAFIRVHPRPDFGAIKGAAQQPQDQRQPDRRPQHGQLQRRIAGQIAGKGEDAARQERGQPVAGQIARQQIGEAAGQRNVNRGLDLEPVEPRRGIAPRQRQSQNQVAQRVEDGGLHVGQERMAGESVRIPERQPAGQQLGPLEQAERQEVIGEIAGREAAQAQEQRGVEGSRQREIAQESQQIGGYARASGPRPVRCHTRSSSIGPQQKPFGCRLYHSHPARAFHS